MDGYVGLCGGVLLEGEGERYNCDYHVSNLN